MKTRMLAMLACAAAVLLAMAPPASAQIVNPKNSADFLYQYNGDTVPTQPGGPGTAWMGWGNLGFGANNGAGLQFTGYDLSSTNGILELKPNVTNPKLSYISHTTNQVWDTQINDTTGLTFEIRLRQAAVSEFPAGTVGTNAHLNRAFFRIGDTADGTSFQLDADDGSLNRSGDMGLITTGLGADQTLDFHTYRFAQPPSSAVTDVWIDDVYKGRVTNTSGAVGTGDNYLQLISVFGWSTYFFIDYIRFDKGGFSPGPEAANPIGDYNDDGVVDAADYTVWRDNLGSDVELPNDDFGGTIGENQYIQWKFAFGNTAGSGSLSAAEVPEPGSSLMVLLASSLVWWRFRR